MFLQKKFNLLIAAIIFAFALWMCTSENTDQAANQALSDPLPSWNQGGTKEAIIGFVEKTTTEGGAEFVPINERIAVFDNDGTLWSEQPLYFQFLFVIDRVKALAPEHPEWKEQQPFKAILENDMQTVMASGVTGLTQLLMAVSSGMTSDDFTSVVEGWIDTAHHPKSGKLYTEMVFQPMLELMDYLRAKGYKTWIVSGGGIGFMRPWTERVYGIPPEQVIGSTVKLKFELVDGSPVIQRLPEIDFIDDKEGKPVGIQNHIGRRPVIAFGNSDGDLQMLQWTAAGEGNRLAVYIHHTDSVREWAYDRESHIGQLDKGLDEAARKGWLVVDMKEDWNKIYPE